MNLNNYIKTVLSGVKTWALSTFANKRDFDELNSRMYYSEQVEKFFFKNTQISPMDSYGNYVNMSFLEKKCDEIRVGDILDVVWDGTEYECKVFMYDGALMVGNKSIIGTMMGESFADTGEPFVIAIWEGQYVEIYYTDIVSESHVISISGMVENVHQIESKYINMPLATQAKPGAVHPWINDDDWGMPVWMHPRTGELYTYDNYYELPVATSTRLGGVKPVAKTSSMTQEVGVNSSGRLYTAPSAQADWNETSTSSAAYIKNKPVIAQADWNESDTSSAAYIKNKPLQAQSDWEQSDETAVDYIKNRICYVDREYKTIVKSGYVNGSNTGFKSTSGCPAPYYVDIGSNSSAEIVPSEIQEGVLCSCSIAGYNNESSYSIMGALSEKIEGTTPTLWYHVFGNRYLLNGVTSPYFYVSDVSVFGSDVDTGEDIAVILHCASDIVYAYVFVKDLGSRYYYGINVSKVDENVHTLDKKYLPADIGVQADWNVTDENSPAYIKNQPRITNKSIILTDEENGFDYVVKMVNGNLVTMQLKGISHLEIASMPEKTSYIEGEIVDLSGLYLNVVYEDGEKDRITDYTYDVDVINVNTTEINLTVERYGTVMSISIPVTVSAFDPAIVLVDFDYTVNNDDTYTITGWKGTLNGATGTELVVPDNSLIIL